MSILPICLYGQNVLRKKADPVDHITPELKKLAEDMLITMYEAPGLGLAAPQVGKSVRLIVVDVLREEIQDEEARSPHIFFNPEVERTEGESFQEEGCLSFSGIRAMVARPEIITFSALNEKGERVRFENAGGIFARCVQHEIDHLDGVLFIDKISNGDKLLLSSKLKKLAKEGKSH